MGVNIYRRRGTKKVYAYYTDPVSKKQKQVKRLITEHLDDQSDEVAERWADEFAEQKGIPRDSAIRKTLNDGDKLHLLWKQYQEQKAGDYANGSGRRDRTIQAETSLFLTHIIPFFVGLKEKKDLKQWSPLVPEFHIYLTGKKLNTSTRRTILWVLKRFSEALVFSGYLSHSFAIRPPKAKYEKVTPLKIRKTPEDILKFAKNTSFSFPKQRKIEGMPNKDRSEIDFILAVLLGYFGGFGPGELFALEKSDLLTGQYAVNNCKTYVGFQKHKLGSRLGVVINKTLPVVGEVVPLVKNDYRYGVSNIWNPTAAKMIADIVSKRPDGRLFPFSYSYLLTRWRQFVRRKLGATPHDLRRASGLYLGRDKRVDLSLLQDHMRHADIQTTMLYCREPATPDNIIKIKQDFDDVA